MSKPHKGLSDQELVQGFIAGDENCFATLLRRHKSRIYATIYLIVKERKVAEDLFQDVMFKIINMLRDRKYNEEGKFVQWSVRIARNMAIDHFRKVQRNPLVHESADYDIFAKNQRTTDSVETKIIRDETHRYLRDMIQELPAKQREVLIMRHYSELSFKEIAELTDVSINTALGRMRYAIINLRKMMGDHDRKLEEYGSQEVRQG
jgi:RNA polymerase sigma factor (sigma-70 family)